MGSQARKETQPAEYDIVDEDAFYTTRMPSSARRYKTAPPPELRETTTVDPTTETGAFILQRRSSLKGSKTHGTTSNAVAPSGLEVQTRFWQHLPVGQVLVGMVVMVVLVMSLSAFASWWHVFQDDQQYGRPRTFQMDAVVGHGDSPNNPTHFIFMNLHRHIQIIELPGGDASRARIFEGPVLYGDGQELVPVTGEVRDVKRDGKPDLIVHIKGQQFVFVNDGTSFHPQ